MAFGNAWGHDGLEYTGKDMRTMARTLARALTGVAGDGDLLVAQQASPATTVQVAAGGVIVAATGAGLFGSYHAYNDAALNSPAFTATSGSGRKDLLIVRVTAGVPALEIVQGTPAGSPTEPPVTGDNYEILALITFPASTTNVTTAMITDRRSFSSDWRRPFGSMVAAAKPSSSTTHTGSFANQTGFTQTFIAVAGRKYRIRAGFHLDNSVGDALSRMRFADGGAAITGAQRQFFFSGSSIWYFEMTWEGTFSAGAHTITLQAQVNTGAGVSETYCDATYNGLMTVDDMGPA